MADNKRNVIDRQSTTPFHLKLFYRQNAFHHLSDFPIPSPGNHAPPLPAHLEIYTWHSCTLRELSQLLSTALPSQLPDPAAGTRLCFRLIYPDTRGAAADGRGRYLSKDMGSVILGASDRKEEDNNDRENGAPGRRRFQEDDADKTLADARFVIGDYIDCAILPPLEDGSVAPPISGRGTVPSSALGGGMRAFGGPGPSRENGYGGRRGSGRGPGNGIPSVDDTQITTNARHSSRHQAKEAKGERTNDANRPSDDEMTTISTPESDAQALEQCNRKRKEKQKILQYALSVILSQLQGQD